MDLSMGLQRALLVYSWLSLDQGSEAVSQAFLYSSEANPEGLGFSFKLSYQVQYSIESSSIS